MEEKDYDEVFFDKDVIHPSEGYIHEAALQPEREKSQLPVLYEDASGELYVENGNSALIRAKAAGHKSAKVLIYRAEDEPDDFKDTLECVRRAKALGTRTLDDLRERRLDDSAYRRIDALEGNIEAQKRELDLYLESRQHQ